MRTGWIIGSIISMCSSQTLLIKHNVWWNGPDFLLSMNPVVSLSADVELTVEDVHSPKG